MGTRKKPERKKHCHKTLLEANCSWQVCAMKEMGGERYLMPFWSEGPTQNLIFQDSYQRVVRFATFTAVPKWHQCQEWQRLRLLPN